MESVWTDRHAGATNGGRIVFADAGTKFTAMSVSPSPGTGLNIMANAHTGVLDLERPKRARIGRADG
jgi:hypothetical protein